MKFTKKQTASYGLGAVGKDMVYALSSGYVMYYFQDVLGISASFVGLILMIARVFDAANDPFMGIIVAKTNTKFGRFRPWIFSGTILNAFVLYALFSVPAGLSGVGLNVYFAVVYILWGVTYTMMDIPFWSLIPAVTKEPKDRERISVVGRTCAGIGNALITVFAMISVQALGGGTTNAAERAGFSWVALIVAVLFAVFETICVVCLKENPSPKENNTEHRRISDMFRTLFANDQAMVVVFTIILINSALYLTSNLLIYFFKYDIGTSGWANYQMIFNMVGGVSQILGMMLVYPLLRKKLSNETIFKSCLCMEIIGYAMILLACSAGMSANLAVICLCGVPVFLGNGILTVLTTVYLSASVDYGELKSGRREESVIFSMQTFVVKLASGLAVFLAGIGIDLIGLAKDTSDTGVIVQQSSSSILGLRLMMTIIPIIGLMAALIIFKKKFILTDKKIDEMNLLLKEKNTDDAA
jgi:melibiose permease